MSRHEARRACCHRAPRRSARATSSARYDDRGFAVGDVLVLQEYVPPICRVPDQGPARVEVELTGHYTDREVEVVVTHVLRGGAFGLTECAVEWLDAALTCADSSLDFEARFEALLWCERRRQRLFGECRPCEVK